MPSCAGRRAAFDVLGLPQELLQRVLAKVPLPQRLGLREVCKSFSSAIAVGVHGLQLRLGPLLSSREDVTRALAVFPHARKVILDVDVGGCVHDHSHHLDTRCGNGAGTSPADVSAVLDMLLHRGGVTSVAIHYKAARGSPAVPPPLPPLSLVAALARRGLQELEITDTSYARATEQGACNTLLHARGIMATSTAMVAVARAAAAAPGSRLRRLSLSAAAFSVVALEALANALPPTLESLSLAGALECSGPEEAAGAFAHLFACLPSVRALRLPMALPCATACLHDSDSDDDGAGWDSLTFGPQQKPRAVAAAPAAAALRSGTAAARLVTRSSAAEAPSLVLPPLLEDLTIALCAFNRPVFEAACAAAKAGADASGAWAEAGSGSARPPPRQGLRALHIAALGGFSHWDGSFLAGERDFELLGQLSSLEVLHLSLELEHMRLPEDRKEVALRGFFQHLSSLKKLRDLRVSAAQQPMSFTLKKRSSHHRFGPGYAPGTDGPFVMPPPAPGASFDALLGIWPDLQRLQFFRDAAVRRGSRLLSPAAPRSCVGAWGGPCGSVGMPGNAAASHGCHATLPPQPLLPYANPCPCCTSPIFMRGG